MDSGARDRSPLRQSHSASASQTLLGSSSFADDPDFTAAQASSGAFNDTFFSHDPHLQHQHQLQHQQSHHPQYSLDAGFDEFAHQHKSQQLLSQGLDLGADDFNNTFFNNHNTTTTGDHVSPSLSNRASPAPQQLDFIPQYDYSDNALDPSLLNNVDLLQPSPLDSSQGGALDPMTATMGSHSPTPPHMLQGMVHHSNSPSPRASPGIPHSPFQPVTRPRNTSESLDPSSAAFPQGHSNDWANIGAYRGHRRMPSDNLSEISSHSNQASPYMGTMDSFDATNNHSSPLLNASQDPAFSDALGIGSFTLNDQLSHHSPAHSPHISPRLVPQQPLPPFTVENNYGLNATMNGHFNQNQNGQDLFSDMAQESSPFPALSWGLSPNQSSSAQSPNGEMGQADHMSPPEINIDFAPPSKPFDAPRPSNVDDSLVPPIRTNRTRAKSDPYAGSRPTTPAISGRGRSPSLQPTSLLDPLSPFEGGSSSASRSPSPRGRSGSLTNRVRSSSATSDQREYILELANPERSPSNGGDSKRQQKHPATFQCHLCPKRFTRAYNLRSHLRTHTDERPFVCTVCGKAFARQHDRKRHEGLHSGEKKFVCRGTLQGGSQWGCGRRFARADALGRHFRSEAGRVCIKPLLDEEAAERQRAWLEEQQQQAQVAAGLIAPQPHMSQPHMDMSSNFLPAALLQQYPALAGIDWTAIPQGNPPPEEDYSGRSSFDASSGGELYDDLSENEVGPYPDQSMGGMNMGMNQNYGAPQQHQQQHQQQINPYATHQMGDFANGFEGR